MKLLLKDGWSLITFLVVAGLVLWLGYAFIDIPTIIGNQGKAYFIVERVSHILLSVLIGMFIATHVYRYRKLRAASGKKSMLGTIGSFLGVLVTGCPACSISVAGMIGLAGIFSALPFAGLEVKVLGLLIMVRVVYKSLVDLLVCKIK